MSRSMSRAGAGLAAVALAGCFSIPPYEAKDGVSYTADGTGAKVAGSRFELSFAGGDGFHFPDALRIDGNNVMGHDEALGCYDEDEIGIQLAPTPRVSATGPAKPVTSRLVSELKGPAVVQVKVEWTTRFECAPTRNPGGTSTFTVFPDGRIVRHDVIADDGPMMISPSDCDCVESNEFSFAPYWTLDKTRVNGFYLPGGTREDLPAVGSELGNKLTACFEGNMFQVAVAWSLVNNTAIRGRGALVSFLRELEITTSPLAAFRYEDASAVFIEHTSCPTALARTKEYTEPRELTIAGVVTTPAFPDGIYGGGDQRGVEVPDGTIELSGEMPGSFAVWLRFPRSVGAVRATRTGAKGEWYLPQKVDDRSWIVWFREPLPINEKISIEPD